MPISCGPILILNTSEIWLENSNVQFPGIMIFVLLYNIKCSELSSLLTSTCNNGSFGVVKRSPFSLSSSDIFICLIASAPDIGVFSFKKDSILFFCPPNFCNSFSYTL
uniref:Orf 00958 protein n=1 Tax=Saccharomyces cerevisiae TaxID=4932 RepID=E9PA65_YEASX|nr:orf 00958 [Saccharomyces cerevisiae]